MGTNPIHSSLLQLGPGFTVGNAQSLAKVIKIAICLSKVAGSWWCSGDASSVASSEKKRVVVENVLSK